MGSTFEGGENLLGERRDGMEKLTKPGKGFHQKWGRTGASTWGGANSKKVS